MKLSIIIPTIGRETLNEVLQSILHADGFDEAEMEVIIIGDGDFSREKIITNNSLFSWVKFLTTHKKSGASLARNLGIDFAQGEIIAFIGDDTALDAAWITQTLDFHKKNPQPHIALLGYVKWIDALGHKSFYQWLNNYAQFSYRKIRLHGAKWNNFYTSNVSLKKEFIDDERFFAEFTGWGFEDSEFGYRLYKRGMNLIYNDKVIVHHDHEQDIDDVCNNFKNARKNAEIFEKLHPELRIIPRGKKLKALKVMIRVAKFFAPIIPETEWWYKWKESWIEEN